MKAHEQYADSSKLMQAAEVGSAVGQTEKGDSIVFLQQL